MGQSSARRRGRGESVLEAAQSAPAPAANNPHNDHPDQSAQWRYKDTATVNDDSKELVHTRQITCRGYRRRDGLWQIEASVSDEKGQAVPFRSRPDVSPGERIHHFSLSVVIDDDYTIRDARATTLAAPWPICTDVATDYRKLIGLRIGPGFKRAVHEVLGGPLGCTHLTDLLGQVANTYMQSSFPDRLARPRYTRARASAASNAPKIRCVAASPAAPGMAATSSRSMVSLCQLDS
jgi:hypothetical protein